MARTMMSFFRGGQTLSSRLSRLQSFYQGESHIWDIGCDHGLLGLSFCHNPEVKSINLVDPSALVVAGLNKKIKDSYITNANLFHDRGQKIEIKSASNCVFIAGMGGKEIGEIILHLLPQLGSDSKFVISPHRKIMELRKLLSELPLDLKCEEVLIEDKQFYQMLVLVPGKGAPVHPYGKDIWRGKEGREYLDHQIRFFSVHRDEASLEYLKYLENLKLLNSIQKP